MNFVNKQRSYRVREIIELGETVYIRSTGEKGTLLYFTNTGFDGIEATVETDNTRRHVSAGDLVPAWAW